jgi:hypothetical protein
MSRSELPLFDDVDPIPGSNRSFFVRSRTDARQRYFVDLDFYGFNGKCGCQNFQFGHEPKLREDRRESRPARRRRCWHINRALVFYAEIRMRLEKQHDERKR